MGSCTSCRSDLPDGARFCPSCGASATGRPLPATHAERRPVTVLFADAVGSTAFTERAGDEAAYRFVQRCVATMSAAIERHGGTITQFRGDGVMALFGAPVARERSAVDAVTAALEIQAALAELGGECDFRVGLSTGPVVVGRVGDDVLMDYTAIGDTANVAARVETAAEPGTVYLSDSTWRAVRQFVECRLVGELDLKGKSATVVVHEALRRRAIQTRLDAAIERGLGPFVGRDRELGLLLGHLGALESGRGHVVELVGEAGIGKSRLLHELHRAAGPDVRWLEGHCEAIATDTPYAPIIEALGGESWSDDVRRLLDVEVGEAMDARLRRVAILDALRGSVDAACRELPRVIVVEDLHWADESSLEALTALAEVAPVAPLLLVTTSRPGHPSPFDGASSHTRVGLDGIATADVTTIAASALDVAHVPADVAALIAGRAEGNPLYVEELTATLVEADLLVLEAGDVRLASSAETMDVPSSLQEVILARIDRLAREARDALQLASVIGREFTVRLLDRLASLPDGIDDALGELRAVELIRQKGWHPELAYLFKHALTHEVTYATLLEERRREMHRLAALAIEDIYATELADHAATLGHHWSVAEDWSRAAGYLFRAAEDAAALFSNDSAISLYRQALDAAERAGDLELAARAGMRLGDVYMAIVDLDAAIETFTQVAELARRNGDPDTLAWALAYKGESQSYMHDLPAGERSILAGLAVDGASVDAKIYGATWLAAARHINGRFDEVAEIDAEIAALRASRPVTHPRAVTATQSLDALRQRWCGDVDVALATMAVPAADSTDFLIVQSLEWERGLSEGEIGRYGDALATLASTIAHSERGGELLFRARSLNTIGWIRGELGDLDGAIEWNERCLQLLRDVDIPDEEVESNARLNLAEAHLRAGLLDRAASELGAVEALNAGRPVRGSWMVWRFRQRMLLLQTELDLSRGRGSVLDGRFEEALDLATASGSRKYVGKARRVQASALLARRELDGAAEHAGVALEVATGMGHPPERWRALVLLADIAAAAGDADAAREHRRAADDVLAGVLDGLADPGCRAGVASLRAALVR